jgi:hypothetical protein
MEKRILLLVLMLSCIAPLASAAEPLTLKNLSVRLRLEGGGVHVGFVVSNSSGGADSPLPIRVLVRASGPSASVFGLSAANGVELKLESTRPRVLATWKTDRNRVAAAAESVGAFPYGTGPGDDAMVLEMPAGGAITLIVSAKQAGESVVEAYQLP